MLGPGCRGSQRRGSQGLLGVLSRYPEVRALPWEVAWPPRHSRGLRMAVDGVRGPRRASAVWRRKEETISAGSGRRAEMSTGCLSCLGEGAFCC